MVGPRAVHLVNEPTRHGVHDPSRAYQVGTFCLPGAIIGADLAIKPEGHAWFACSEVALAAPQDGTVGRDLEPSLRGTPWLNDPDIAAPGLRVDLEPAAKRRAQLVSARGNMIVRGQHEAQRAVGALHVVRPPLCRLDRHTIDSHINA